MLCVNLFIVRFLKAQRTFVKCTRAGRHDACHSPSPLCLAFNASLLFNNHDNTSPLGASPLGSEPFVTAICMDHVSEIRSDFTLAETVLLDPFSCAQICCYWWSMRKLHWPNDRGASKKRFVFDLFRTWEKNDIGALIGSSNQLPLFW